LNDSEVERMRREAEANADADRMRKELIEARNQADNTIYTAEKMLREYGEKVDADVKKKIEDGVTRLRQTLNTENVEQIRKDTDQLGQDVQAIGASMYQQPGAPQGAPGDGSAPGGNGGPQEGSPQGDQQSGSNGEDVVDGEFRNA
jgi:molecular chaperone DnaK